MHSAEVSRDGLCWAPIPGRTLNIPATLDSGQTFRWRQLPGGDWVGAVGRLAVRLRPEACGFWWQTYPVPGQWQPVERYFALDVDLERLFDAWRRAEPRMARSIERYAGMRILRQPAEEAFFSFVCASCNTVTKIKRTVWALAARYGLPIAEVDALTLYRFPTIEAIAAASEDALRADLWGYRAPRLIALARHAAQQGPEWLSELSAKPYEEAHAELTALHGIGAKLADCICLFGLGHDEACPIDTHVRQIAVRLFRPDLARRSLTPGVYAALAQEYRDRFGEYAGWAQQYLFFGELYSQRQVQRRDEENGGGSTTEDTASTEMGVAGGEA